MEGKLGSVFKHVYKSPVGNVIILIEEDFLTSLSFLENTKNNKINRIISNIIIFIIFYFLTNLLNLLIFLQ